MTVFYFTTPRVILFVCISFYLAAIPAFCSNNETDYRALLAFKNAIQSDPMGALVSWNETVPFCRWQGIFCSHRHQNRVVAIDLTSQGLTGPISPHLGNLSFLRTIILQNNTFTGQIPNEIGTLRRLEQVYFSNNSLSGQIPSNLSQCTKIHHLYLNGNKLTGNIPPELSLLVNLETVALGLNQLSGTIPPFIGNFTSLEKLSLRHCGMQGEIPESLVQLESLNHLSLGLNNLTGSIPPGLFNSSAMASVDLSANRLRGTIPSDIGTTSSNLRLLYLWKNLLTGEIPAFLANSSSLKRLILTENNLSGRVKIDFGRLSALTVIDIGGNYLGGDLNFISSMVNCTQLEDISINSNQLSGSLPHSISNLSSSLEVLGISNNQFYGRIPPGIGDLPNLMGIYFEDNDFSGPIPSEISKLKKLQVLYLSGSKFTSEIPSSFGNLTSLLYLGLDRNNLSGNVPQSLGNCTNLLEFNISYNSLNGMVPPQVMSQLSNSFYLDLSYNALSGSIPVEVGSLINLELLDMSYNKLSGRVPESLSSCLRLEQIYLQSNSFSGEIPDELRTLRGLQRVDLSRNNLSGSIPKFLGEFNLLYLNLSCNKLEGRVPSQGVFLNESAISLEGNKDLCGGIPSLNFARCSIENAKEKHFSILFKVVVIPVISFGAMALGCYCIYICITGKSKHAQTSDRVSPDDEYLRLSYADLQKSTGGFSDLNLLGSGKFGLVYKGVLHNVHGYVAVKVLNLNVTGASESFISECNVLRSTRHRNLVKIVSVCSSTDFQGNEFKALVYEFMVNKDLDQWLHKNSVDDRGTLRLTQRLYTILDIAAAVEYLHFGTDSTIVHGDLKPSNVLFDEKMTACLGDFGLAKIISNTLSTNESSCSCAAIRGTIGYIPPEYGMGGNVSTHGDVYSYGILLLEILTGKRPTDDVFKDSWSLPVFVTSGLSSDVMEILDPNILQEYRKENDVELKKCVTAVLEIGLACSAELPGDRMDITDVVNRLLELIERSG